MLIAHASAGLTDSDIGFIHGIAIAAAHGGYSKLITLHVPTRDTVVQPPQLQHWLKRWGLSGDCVKQSFVSYGGYEDPVDGLLSACRATKPDLLIVPTHARAGLSRVLGGSIAEAVARNLSIPTLLLPLGGRRLADEQTGQLTLDRVLVLGDSQPDGQLGVDAASWFVREVGHAHARVTMLHVNDRSPFPHMSDRPEMKPRVQHRAGELTDVVVMVCAELQPQLVVMVSHGHDQIADVVLANRTERVLRAANRPLLWVPTTFAPRADQPVSTTGSVPAGAHTQ